MLTKRRQDKTESENTDIYDENICNTRIIKNKHEIFLNKCAKIAEKSQMQQKHGAVIVYKNKIIATGYNYICSYMNNNYSIHAEVSAISQVFYNKKLLEECDIYVVRIASPMFNYCLKNSKPCKNCTCFIRKYNLRNIYYSTNYRFDELNLNLQ